MLDKIMFFVTQCSNNSLLSNNINNNINFAAPQQPDDGTITALKSLDKPEKIELQGGLDIAFILCNINIIISVFIIGVCNLYSKSSKTAEVFGSIFLFLFLVCLIYVLSYLFMKNNFGLLFTWSMILAIIMAGIFLCASIAKGFSTHLRTYFYINTETTFFDIIILLSVCLLIFYGIISLYSGLRYVPSPNALRTYTMWGMIVFIILEAVAICLPYLYQVTSDSSLLYAVIFGCIFSIIMLAIYIYHSALYVKYYIPTMTPDDMVGWFNFLRYAICALGIFVPALLVVLSLFIVFVNNAPDDHETPMGINLKFTSILMSILLSVFAIFIISAIIPTWKFLSAIYENHTALLLGIISFFIMLIVLSGFWIRALCKNTTDPLSRNTKLWLAMVSIVIIIAVFLSVCIGAFNKITIDRNNYYLKLKDSAVV